MRIPTALLRALVVGPKLVLSAALILVLITLLPTTLAWIILLLIFVILGAAASGTMEGSVVQLLYRARPAEEADRRRVSAAMMRTRVASHRRAEVYVRHGGPGVADQPEDAGAIGFIDVPWAVDANGAPVPTHFQVHGNTLTQVVDLDAATAFPVVADPDLIFFAKCGAAVALFIAENSAIAGKFWRVFKSRKALISMFKGLKGMKMSTKIRYVASRLGTEASKMSGIQDLVLRCTP